MKNLKAQFKLIIYIIIFFSTHGILQAKNLDKFQKADKLSNYFSGIMSISNNDFENSYRFLKKLNGLEDDHYQYINSFQQSLISLDKINEALKYSKTLERKNLDNFESNLIIGIYYLKNDNIPKAKEYFTKLNKNKNLNLLQELLYKTLNNWSNISEIKDIRIAISLMENFPKRFKNIKKIQNLFIHCRYDSADTDKVFKDLLTDTSTDLSRYYFFYSNYFLKKGNKLEAKKILNTALKKYPRNLLLNQLKIDIDLNKDFTDQFNCKNIAEVIGEIFYITANALSATNNYSASNFYLNLANYLNPRFASFQTLHAENLFNIQKLSQSKKIYKQIKKKGSIYDWHASKKIAFILEKENKNKESLKYLSDVFKKISNPPINKTYDFAEFLKRNEKFKESITYYSEVLNKISRDHHLYTKATFGRGIAYERTDQWEKSEVDLLNSLSVLPNQPYVMNYLAYSWVEKGLNISKSLEMLEKANSLKKEDGYIIDSLGWAMFKLKKYEEAKKYLELAVIFMPSDPVVNDHFGDALWMNKNTLQARYYWNYVLNLKETDQKLKNTVKDKLIFGLKIKSL
jgi:tetratricopeptide (TPR) repeat protein